MKLNDFNNYKNSLNSSTLEQMFNVYVDKDDFAKYNLNSTLVMSDPFNVSLSNFKIYIPKANDTLMSIAYKTYGDIRLYWLIAKLNGIKIIKNYKLTTNHPLLLLDKDTVNLILSKLPY